MPQFVIKAADERGHMLEQVETGLSEREVRDRYTQQGMLVYSVRQRGMLAGGEVQLARRRVRLDQFVIFNQQFVTLVRAGLPIVNALELLIKRQRDAYFRSLLENVHSRVKSGELLSSAFEAQGVFPKIYTTTLLAGEKSGNLEEVLNRYIMFQRLTITFRKKLMASLVYPALLVVLVMIMLTFLVTYVVPQFANLYSQLKAELPAITAFMLAMGVGAQKYFVALVAAIAIAAMLVWRWRQSEGGSRRLERIQMSLPILGEVWLKYQVATFARMMATLLSGGLPLVPALETAGGSLGSRILSHSLVAAAQRVREGQALSRALEETGNFPELAVEMIEVGEGTGALPAMLTSVAEFYEEDVQTALTAAMALIEPAILIFMGSIVAFVLLSLYLPIFSLGSAGLAR
jgi:type IV pilus assembly protein PilC